MKETCLVTGGAGYIGSHLVARLLLGGWRVVVLDDLSSGSEDALDRAERLGAGWVERAIGDLCDRDFVHGVFARWPVDAVVHLAAWKSVAGSAADPEGTERVNLGGTEVLAEAMARAGVRRVVHASTAAVYGQQTRATLVESAPLDPLSPYARTKLRAEAVLDAGAADRGWSTVQLRFFNVCGAHPSGLLGEPLAQATNLFPVALKAALGDRRVAIFGTDYPTRDGTCVRDYVHVEDIVDGIEGALALTRGPPGTEVLNLGTGRGSTVREVLDAIEAASGVALERVDGPRRPGDPVVSVASSERAWDRLGWRPQRDLRTISRHAWAWASGVGAATSAR